MKTIPAAEDRPTDARTRRWYWLALVGLFALSQALNVWIITHAVSGGFPGWLAHLRG